MTNRLTDALRCSVDYGCGCDVGVVKKLLICGLTDGINKSRLGSLLLHLSLSKGPLYVLWEYCGLAYLYFVHPLMWNSYFFFSSICCSSYSFGFIRLDTCTVTHCRTVGGFSRLHMPIIFFSIHIPLFVRKRCSFQLGVHANDDEFPTSIVSSGVARHINHWFSQFRWRYFWITTFHPPQPLPQSSTFPVYNLVEIHI